jgi:hypothetical protein
MVLFVWIGFLIGLLLPFFVPLQLQKAGNERRKKSAEFYRTYC